MIEAWQLAIEKKDMQALARELLRLAKRKVEIENAYRRRLIQSVDFMDRKSLEKQELELLKRDAEALRLKEELEMVGELYRALRTVLEVLGDTSDVIIYGGLPNEG
jgi:hypothetical protein